MICPGHKWRGEVIDYTCKDCHTCTRCLGEYYMVRDRIWSLAHFGPTYERGMLCIGCLEARLGRRLYLPDFSQAPINHLTQIRKPDGSLHFSSSKSQRLTQRLTP